MAFSTKQHLLTATILAAAGWTGPAFAQSAPASPSETVTEVVVTGSRVIRDGAQAPTPVTVVGVEQLQATAPNNIADALRELPQFQGSTSSRSTGLISTTIGQNFLNLRGLGAQRGLVLLDGRRFVNANTTGGVDVNLFPQALVSRVDVVTGGASAAYGSDAVAGVTNFILDTKFEGLKGEVQYGISERGDGDNYKGSFQIGGGLLDGRGHFIASAEYARSEGVIGNALGADDDRSFQNSYRTRVPNPAVTATNPASATNPRFIAIDNARLASVNYSGVVQSGPFANMTFNADGTLAPYNQGAFRSGTFASGGDGWNPAPGTVVENPVIRSNFFFHGDFRLTDSLKIYAEASAARSHSNFVGHPFYTQSTFTSGFLISADNPYLAAQTRAQLAAAGQTGLRVNFVAAQFPLRRPDTLSNTRRFVLGFEGDAGEKWSYSGYYQYGENDFDLSLYHNVNAANFLLAVDAVRNPAGQIVCRSSLTNPQNGCSPINVLGNNPVSALGLAYVSGTQVTTQHTTQEVAEAQVNGQPFSLWAGPLSVAAGFGYRREATDGRADPLSTAANPVTGARTGGWFFQNTAPINGAYSLWEAFGEVQAPILRDVAFAKAFDINAAVRYTDYKLSGGVTTWKLGGVWQPIDGLRVRVTRSRDIRAGTLSELFGTPTTIPANIVDHGLPTPLTYVTQQVQSGNPAVQPERADTWTYGVVFQPTWAPGLLASVDAYDVDIKGAIGSITPQNIVDQCVAGVADRCGLITRDPTTGLIQSIAVVQLNLAAIKTKGVDFELSYRSELSDWNSAWDGTLSARIVASHQYDFFNTAPGATPINLAGANTIPDWRASASVTYQRGPMTLSLEERWVGSQKVDANLTEIDIADNRLPDYFTTDVSVRYRFESWSGRYEVFGVVENLFDKAPPISFNRNFFQTPYVAEVYDGIGRAYRVGLRGRF